MDSPTYLILCALAPDHGPQPGVSRQAGRTGVNAGPVRKVDKFFGQSPVDGQGKVLDRSLGVVETPVEGAVVLAVVLLLAPADGESDVVTIKFCSELWGQGPTPDYLSG